MIYVINRSPNSTVIFQTLLTRNVVVQSHPFVPLTDRATSLFSQSWGHLRQ